MPRSRQSLLSSSNDVVRAMFYMDLGIASDSGCYYRAFIFVRVSRFKGWSLSGSVSSSMRVSLIVGRWSIGALRLSARSFYFSPKSFALFGLRLSRYRKQLEILSASLAILSRNGRSQIYPFSSSRLFNRRSKSLVASVRVCELKYLSLFIVRI